MYASCHFVPWFNLPTLFCINEWNKLVILVIFELNQHNNCTYSIYSMSCRDFLLLFLKVNHFFERVHLEKSPQQIRRLVKQNQKRLKTKPRKVI